MYNDHGAGVIGGGGGGGCGGDGNQDDGDDEDEDNVTEPYDGDASGTDTD